MIADVGLVGFPSVGKSSLLARVSNARPKIAEYHFTTLTPNLGVVSVKNGSGFVMADIPGIIEGASEGKGLGLNFLRHIERTKVLIHVVDASGTSGRDMVDDIKKINEELASYSRNILDRPTVLAANKMDILTPDEREIAISLIEDEFPDYKIFPISAATGEGINEMLLYVDKLVKEAPDDLIIFEPEIDIEELYDNPDLPFEVKKDEKDDHVYIIEGPRIEKMLGYTNLEAEKGFLFFQNFLKKNGILKMLEDLGIEDGDTVRMYGHEFDYYHE